MGESVGGCEFVLGNFDLGPELSLPACADRELAEADPLRQMHHGVYRLLSVCPQIHDL